MAQTMARPIDDPISIIRRPPFMRSSAGPTMGATTANGATVSNK